MGSHKKSRNRKARNQAAKAIERRVESVPSAAEYLAQTLPSIVNDYILSEMMDWFMRPLTREDIAARRPAFNLRDVYSDERIEAERRAYEEWYRSRPPAPAPNKKRHDWARDGF